MDALSNLGSSIFRGDRLPVADSSCARWDLNALAGNIVELSAPFGGGAKLTDSRWIRKWASCCLDQCTARTPVPPRPPRQRHPPAEFAIYNRTLNRIGHARPDISDAWRALWPDCDRLGPMLPTVLCNYGANTKPSTSTQNHDLIAHREG